MSLTLQPTNEMTPLVRYYVTSNRRSPIVAMFSVWPGKSNLSKCCRAGVQIASRKATDEEFEFVRNAPRYTALRWVTVAGFLRDERDYLGREWCRELIAALREHRSRVQDCFKACEAKAAAHARKLVVLK